MPMASGTSGTKVEMEGVSWAARRHAFADDLDLTFDGRTHHQACAISRQISPRTQGDRAARGRQCVTQMLRELL